MKRILLQLLLVSSLLIPACSSSQISGPKRPQALQPTAVSTALFQVIKPDGSKVGVTIDVPQDNWTKDITEIIVK